MTAEEIRAELEKNGKAVQRLTKNDEPMDLREFTALMNASYIGGIAAQLAELNALLNAVADHVLPLERK